MKFVWILNKKNNTKILSLDGGKYQYENIDEVPDEYLEWVVENYSKTRDLEKLFTAQNAIEVRMKRVCEDLDLKLEKYEIPTITLEYQPSTKQRKLLFKPRGMTVD